MKLSLKKHILIIEDEPAFIEILRFSLENAGFEVMSALTGQDGIKKARLLPDLILLDVMMPVMDGYEVCRQLKQNEETKYIPIIMLTARDETIEKIEAFELGIVDYICKHVPFLEILARIKAVLRQFAEVKGQGLDKQKKKKIIEVKEIIADKKIKVCFSAIAALSDKELLGFEALLRGPELTDFEDPLILFRWAAEAGKKTELENLYYSLALEKIETVTGQERLFLKTDPANLSKRSFKELDFLKGSVLKPAQIYLELSEHICLQDVAEFSRNLTKIKNKGVNVVIDDVGEGYSSLKTIAELTPDFIKTSGYLSRDINADSQKQKLMQTIISQARKIKTDIIANNITTTEEAETLFKLGVKYGQGGPGSREILFIRP